MRSRGATSKSEDEILSNEEQQKIIDDLKSEASNQSNYFRKVFSFIFMSIAAVFGICLCYSWYQPWGLYHQQHFVDKIPHVAFLAYYTLSMYCFVVAGLLVKVGFNYSSITSILLWHRAFCFLSQDPTHSTLIQINRYSGYAVGVFVLLSWLHVFHKHSITNPIMFWLPLADLAGLLLAQYVDFDSFNLVQSMENLENFRYEHKSVWVLCFNGKQSRCCSLWFCKKFVIFLENS